MAKANMARRHFELIAATIRDLDGTMTREDCECIAEHFAAALRTTSPNFQHARFLAACLREK